jgi:hypothetical protein
MVMNDRELDERLRRLPRETEPPVDYWPAIQRHTAYRRSHLALRAAAAAVIFLAGLAVGRATLPDRDATSSPTPFFVSTEIQRSGTAYLSALAQLRTIAPTTHDSLAVRQGYEAAVAVMEDASKQIAASMRELGPDLVRETNRARTLAAQRVKLALRGRQQ